MDPMILQVTCPCCLQDEIDIDVCRNLNKRWWAPSVFTTENYVVVPSVEDSTLKWRLFAKTDAETEVLVPHFSDAYKMVETLEKNLVDQIQQS